MEENPVQNLKKKSRKLTFFLVVLLLFLLAGGVSTLLPDDRVMSRQRIGLVEIKGMITDASETIRQISKFRKDSSIRGIVLRIDSPGGAVAPSQEIYSEVLKLKSQKKVFASMGSVAASGGYYIASAADQIIANPGTLTGSIGVIMTFANVEQLMGKIGLRPETLKSGKFKDTGSPTRPMTPEERKLLQSVIDNVYDQFVSAVAKGRKMEVDKVKELADGRIYTGKQAFDLKLVDRLGSLEDTISMMGKAVGIEGEPKVVQEKPSRGIFDLLMEGSLSERVMGSIAPQFPLLQYLWTL
jgi:protease-4